MIIMAKMKGNQKKLLVNMGVEPMACHIVSFFDQHTDRT